MEAAFINKDPSFARPFTEAAATFFKSNTPDSVKVFCWQLFKCWATKDCKEITDLSDEEVALFFDQLIDLVAAAHIEHQANGASALNSKEGFND